MRRMRGVASSVFGLGCLILSWVGNAVAHPAQFTTLQVQVEANGRFHATLNIDILAYARMETSSSVDDASLAALLDGPRDALAQQLAEANDHFRREVVVRTDAGNALVTQWTLPGLADVDAVAARHLQPRVLLPGEIAFSGTLPAGAHTLAVRLPYVLGDTLHILETPDGRTAGEPVAAGGFSSGVRLDLPVAAQVSTWQVVGRYLVLGFKHIVPEGLDHILFVLGLFLLSTHWRPLLWQVTAFTVAHSITLALSLYGVVRLPASVVEPTIAASIVFVAVENILTTRLQTWRVFVVFIFGLVHGLGFAGVLRDLGLPRQAFVTGFNWFQPGRGMRPTRGDRRGLSGSGDGFATGAGTARGSWCPLRP